MLKVDLLIGGQEKPFHADLDLASDGASFTSK